MATYAIGISKGWIELRSARKEPQAVVSKLIRDSTRPVPVAYDFEHDRYIYKDIPYKMTMRTHNWTGGRPLKVVPTRKFSSILGLVVKTNQCIKLTPQQTKTLMKETIWLNNG